MMDSDIVLMFAVSFCELRKKKSCPQSIKENSGNLMTKEGHRQNYTNCSTCGCSLPSYEGIYYEARNKMRFLFL